MISVHLSDNTNTVDMTVTAGDRPSHIAYVQEDALSTEAYSIDSYREGIVFSIINSNFLISKSIFKTRSMKKFFLEHQQETCWLIAAVGSH